MNAYRWFAALPRLVFLIVAVWLGVTGWEVRRAQLEETRLRAKFEALLQSPPVPPKRAEPVDPGVLPEVYRDLIERALKLGLQVREVNPGAEDGILIVEGGFEEAYAMLEAVRELDHPVWVKGLEIVRLDDEGRRLAVTYTLGVRLAVPGEEGLEEDEP